MSRESECIGADGLPVDKSCLECGLPSWLGESIEQMRRSWERVDNGEEDTLWDCYWCELQSEINNAEVNGFIDTETAWHLRERYLRIQRPGEIE